MADDTKQHTVKVTVVTTSATVTVESTRDELDVVRRAARDEHEAACQRQAGVHRPAGFLVGDGAGT